MHEEELTKLKKKVVADTRSLQGTHKSNIQALLDTVATIRKERVQERAAWEETAATSAAERKKMVEEVNTMHIDFQRMAQDGHNQGRECAWWKMQAERALSEVQGLREEREATLMEVPRGMEKLQTKAEKEWKQGLLATAGGMGGDGVKLGKETPGQGPKTDGVAGATSPTTTIQCAPLLPSFGFLPSLAPPALSFDASAARAAATAVAAPTTINTSHSLLAPFGSSSLFSRSFLYGSSSPSSAFASIAPPPSVASVSPANVSPAPLILSAPPDSSLFSNINPLFASSEKLWTTPTENEPAPTNPVSPQMAATAMTTLFSYQTLPSFSPAFRKEKEETAAASKEEKVVTPPALETKTATNVTASLLIAPNSPILPKAPTCFAKPATKQEGAMPVLIKREIHTSTKLMALSEEKEKESEQAAAAPQEREEAAKAPLHLRRQLRRGLSGWMGG